MHEEMELIYFLTYIYKDKCVYNSQDMYEQAEVMNWFKEFLCNFTDFGYDEAKEKITHRKAEIYCEEAKTIYL